VVARGAPVENVPLDADAERVDLVLSNLVGNALKYTPAGGAVELGAAEDGGAVRFEVRDSGPGIAAEYHAAIFEKYFRVPGAAAGGVGLGLWLAREIVEAHGGRIGVESAPGQGSVFWFTLPRAGEARAAAPATA
jgi:signal transduction histidine kinase